MTYVAATPRERGGLFGDLDEQMKEVDKLGLSKEQFVETVKKVCFFVLHTLIKVS